MSSDNTAWINPLIDRYQHIIDSSDTPDATRQQALNTLQLAGSTLDKLVLNDQHPEHGLQIAVMGPTQSGKSTLVNALLDVQSAKASALAGFTVHAQGYADILSGNDLQAIDQLMQPLRRTPASELNSRELGDYALESVVAGNRAAVTQAVIWDTPDFDSIEANTYKSAVFKTAALADVIVLIVSKDKYGDKSVWDMLSLLNSLQREILVVINKLDHQDRTVVENAFVTRHRELFDADPSLFLLPFISDPTGQKSSLLRESIVELGEAINQIDVRSTRAATALACKNYIQSHETTWLEPLHDELQARNNWQVSVEQAIAAADEYYSRAYLNNPDKYDTFNRALAELLTLLEIPGVAGTLGRARQLVTWPARKLLGVGRTAISRATGTSGNDSNKDHDNEEEVLLRILDTALIRLQTELLEADNEPWWHALNQQFRLDESTIRENYNARSAEVRKQFEPRIEAAAAELYEQLQTQPALLNTLRAARATADAAGIAIAVKTGGLAPADLILAPAMLSVTTLLTESALGRYLDASKRQLLEAQRQHVNDHLLSAELGTALISIADTLSSDSLYTKDIDPALEDHILSVFDDKLKPTHSD